MYSMTKAAAEKFIQTDGASQQLAGHLPRHSSVDQFLFRPALTGAGWTALAINRTDGLRLTDDGYVLSCQAWALYDNGTVRQCSGRQEVADANIWVALLT